MQHHEFEDDQLLLFSKHLRWTEISPEARQQTCQLLALMCLEIVTKQITNTEGYDHEPRNHSILAS